MIPPLQEALPVPASPEWGSPPGPPGLRVPPASSSCIPEPEPPGLPAPRPASSSVGRRPGHLPPRRMARPQRLLGRLLGAPAREGPGLGRAEKRPWGGQRLPCSRTARLFTSRGLPFLSSGEQMGAGPHLPGSLSRLLPSSVPVCCQGSQRVASKSSSLCAELPTLGKPWPAAPWGPHPILSPSTTAPSKRAS